MLADHVLGRPRWVRRRGGQGWPWPGGELPQLFCRPVRFRGRVSRGGSDAVSAPSGEVSPPARPFLTHDPQRASSAPKRNETLAMFGEQPARVSSHHEAGGDFATETTNKQSSSYCNLVGIAWSTRSCQPIAREIGAGFFALGATQSELRNPARCCVLTGRVTPQQRKKLQ